MPDPRQHDFVREACNFALWLLLACAACAIVCNSAFPQSTYYAQQQRRGLLGLRRTATVYATSATGQAAPPAALQLTTYGRGGPCQNGWCPAPPPVQRAPTPAIDYRAILDAMARDARFRGPPGLNGSPGRDGSPGQPGKDGAPGQPTKLRDDERQAIVDRIAAELRSDLEFEPVNLDQLAERVAEKLRGGGGEGLTAGQAEELAKRIAALERAKISIEMFDPAGKLIQSQSRALGGEPFYFGQRPAN